MAALPLPPGLPPAPPPLPAGFPPAPGQNPMGYAPKDQNFVDTQRDAGFAHSLYRTTGSSVIDRTNANHVTGLANWTQPGAGLPAFQLPPPGSQASRNQLAAAIQARGRGAGRSDPGAFNAGFPPRPSRRDRRELQEIVNDPNADMGILNLAFVKQLDWVSGTDKLSQCSPLHTSERPAPLPAYPVRRVVRCMF